LFHLKRNNYKIIDILIKSECKKCRNLCKKCKNAWKKFSNWCNGRLFLIQKFLTQNFRFFNTKFSIFNTKFFNTNFFSTKFLTRTSLARNCLTRNFLTRNFLTPTFLIRKLSPNCDLGLKLGLKTHVKKIRVKNMVHKNAKMDSKIEKSKTWCKKCGVKKSCKNSTIVVQ